MTASSCPFVRKFHLHNKTQVFTNFTWGSATRPVILIETDGVGAEARTRTWTYYDDPPYTVTSSQIPVKTVTEPDGAWRTMSYDQFGRVINELSAIDTALTDQSSLCRRVVYSYASQDAADDLTRSTNSPRKVDEYWKDQLIRRTYYVYSSQSSWPHYDKTVQCPNPSSAIGDSANLVSTTYYVDQTAAIQYQANPDGTVVVPTIVTNAGGGFTVTTDTGESDGANPPAVLNGTRTQKVSGPTGTIIAQQTWAISQGTLGPLTASVVYSGFDAFDRATRADYLDGTYETYSYACCGLDTITGRDGLTYKIEYDPLRRVIGRTALSFPAALSTTNVLDAAGRITATVRNGGGNWAIVQNRKVYDTAGRVLSEFNALNGQTTYSESLLNGIFRQEITICPDGGTITNLYLPNGSLSNVTGTATFPVRYQYGVESDGGIQRFYTKEIKLDNAGGANEWVKRYEDGLGRVYKTVYAAASGSPAQTYFFNVKGQLEKEVDPDTVTTLYRYIGQGQLVVTAIDLDQDGKVANYDPGYSGKDRVTQTTTTFLASGAPGNTRGMDIQRSETLVWTTDNSAATAKLSTTDTACNGLRTWQTVYRDQSTPVVTVTDVSLPTAGNNWTRTVTVTAPDGSKTVSVYQYGRLLSVTRKNSSNNQVTSVTYAYDAHGRQSAITDARNGATTYTFNSADQILTTTAPDTSSGSQVTTTTYDNMGRTTGVTSPDGTSTANLYFPNGLLQKTWGARTYPVEYLYDAQGRMRTNKTWQNFSAGTGAAITRWNYDPYRGWLKSKDYADPTTGNPPVTEGTSGPVYDYTPAGRLRTRTWLRTGTGGQRIASTYTYGFDAVGTRHGDLTQIQYSNDPQSTPSVTYTYDRRGRRARVLQNGITTGFTYNDANQVTREGFTNGLLAGLAVNRTFNGYLQNATLSLAGLSSGSYSVSYGYDNAGRLQTVSEGNSSATYSFLANSPLVSQILFAQSGETRMTTTRQYDRLNRLQSISSAATGPAAPALPLGLGYTYNQAGQRIRATLADGSYWAYSYDDLGQVISGKRYWQDGTPVAGQQFEYAFDHIGNRTATQAGGDGSGGSLRPATYTPTRLNQYTQRTVPGYADLLGIANPTANVTVNGNTAARKGEYFSYALSTPNTSVAQYPSVSVVSAYGATQTSAGPVFVPKTPEVYGYDPDGNLTNDGRWAFFWDAENRLVKMLPSGTVSAPAGSRRQLEFAYDYQGRRIWQKVTNLDTSGVTERRFVYDGWNLLATLNPQSSTLAASFVWGLDLSGSLQGAGGIGGLLRVTHVGAQTTNCFVAFDGNGNVHGLVDAADANLIAQYEYGPFGEVLRATGPMAKANPFRFSTKYQDDETELFYYGYRYYNASSGRWVTRDPIGEQASLQQYVRLHKASELPNESPLAPSAYLFLDSNPVSHTDMDGCRMTPSGDVAITDKNRRNPPGKMMLIQVPKCTILFVYGHNYVNNFEKKGLQWIWNIVPGADYETQKDASGNDVQVSLKGCSYAAVAGCSANLVPNEIPLPGFNYSDYDVGDQGTISGTILLQMWRDVRDKYALAGAEQICRNCDCKEVTLRWQRVGATWFDGLFDLTPKEVKFPCPCKAPTKTPSK